MIGSKNNSKCRWLRFFSISLICLASCAGLKRPCQAAEPFKIVKSFPVSEPTWGAKAGDLYLVGAERSLLVYHRTGAGPDQYELVNKIFTGLDGYLENGVVDGDRLYLGLSRQGILVYRLNDLPDSNAVPLLRYHSAHSIGPIGVAGDRLYALYREGGMAVFDKATLTLQGEGLSEVPLFGLTATASGVLYASAFADYTEMLVVDARDPARISIAKRLKGVGHAYPTMYYWPGAVADQTLYVAEFNGGVGVYDLTDPLNPVLRFRYGATNKPANSRDLAGAITRFALNGGTGYLIRDHALESVAVTTSTITPLQVFAPASSLPSGGFASLWVNDGALAVPTLTDGLRFFDLAQPAAPVLQLAIDLPSRMEGLAKVGGMVYVTADEDGIWQLDWEAAGGPWMRRRVPLKGLAEDLTLYQNHIYVANGIGLGVIDVADENNPQQVFYWDYPYTSTPNINEGWVEGVDVDGDKLYVALGPGGMGVFDLANPSQPALLATIKPGTWGNDVVVEHARHLLAFTGMAKFALIDVADPARPVVLSNLPAPEGFVTQGAVFSPDGKYLVLCQNGHFSIFDVRDPAAPVLLKTYTAPSAEGALFFHGYLLVSGRGGGVSVWTIGATPADLTQVQTLPCYFYNSKFWVEGDRIFTNAEGVDELMLNSAAADKSWLHVIAGTKRSEPKGVTE